MRSRVLLLATVLVLLSSFAIALDVNSEVPMRKRTISDAGSPAAEGPETISCTNRYYHVCGASQECVGSALPGSCCNQCVFSDGRIAPCQTCSAGV